MEVVGRREPSVYSRGFREELPLTSRPAKHPALWIISVLGLLAMAIWWVSRSHLGDEPSQAQVQAQAAAPAEPTETPPVVPAVKQPEVTSGAPEASRDPEKQPRAYVTHELRDLADWPAGFEADDLELTGDGVRLAEPRAGDLSAQRSGTLLSKPVPFDFPSNAVSLLWKDSLPSGTHISSELSVSVDGEHWNAWHPVRADEDRGSGIRERYPDGTLNPHHGFTPSPPLAWGLRQWKYVRYRFTLASEAGIGQSPTLSAVRLYYQDTTLGQGYVPEVAP